MPNDPDYEVHVMCDEHDYGWTAVARDGRFVSSFTNGDKWFAITSAVLGLQTLALAAESGA